MILSNEPGYYKKGKFGIRIENLVYVKKSKRKLFWKFNFSSNWYWTYWFQTTNFKWKKHLLKHIMVFKISTFSVQKKKMVSFFYCLTF